MRSSEISTMGAPSINEGGATSWPVADGLVITPLP